MLDNYRMAYGEEPHYPKLQPPKAKGDAKGKVKGKAKGKAKGKGKAELPRLHWRVYCWTSSRKHRALPVACSCMCDPRGRCTSSGAKRRPQLAACPHCPQVPARSAPRPAPLQCVAALSSFAQSASPVPFDSSYPSPATLALAPATAAACVFP